MYHINNLKRLVCEIERLIMQGSPLDLGCLIRECWAVARRSFIRLATRDDQRLTPTELAASNRVNLTLLIKAASANVAFIELCNLYIENQAVCSGMCIKRQVLAVYKEINAKEAIPRRLTILRVPGVGSYPLVWQSPMAAAQMFGMLGPSSDSMGAASAKILQIAKNAHITAASTAVSTAASTAADSAEQLEYAEFSREELDYSSGAAHAAEEVSLTSDRLARLELEPL